MSTSANTRSVLLAALLAAPCAFAHVGIWHPSVFGFNASGKDPEHWWDSPVNTDFIRNPLRLDMNYKRDEWWLHGVAGATPTEVMQLPAGGKVNIEHSCNKAFTSYTSRPDQLELAGDMPCLINQDSRGYPHYGDPKVEASNGPLHVSDKADAKGCGLTIAYTNDAHKTTSDNFVVFSTNHTCVWTRNIEYQIPANMPACPEGGCICAWNWIHGNMQGEGYGNEMYMVGFRCNITNAKPNAPPLAKPQKAVLCDYDSSKCVKGAKQGLFWEGAASDGWNIPLNESTRQPPFYNSDWGFADGAQNDIFNWDAVATSTTQRLAATSNKNIKVINASATSSARPAISTAPDRQPIVTETVYVTRTTLVTVTAQPNKAKRAPFGAVENGKRHAFKRRMDVSH